MTQEFQTILADNRIFHPWEVSDFCKSVDKSDIVTIKGNISYINEPCAFDTETSSFFRTSGNGKPEKVACMYVWSMGLNGAVMVGRTWDEFTFVVGKIAEILELSLSRRIILYVHNLAYDFQFFRKWLEWDKVFSLDKRKPVYAVCKLGVEFRCSFILSGYSLENIGDKHLMKYKVTKKVGQLDYSKLRHSQTHLYETEMEYIVDDVKVVMAFIAETIENDGDISKIPLTKTGYVRTFCKNYCFYGKEGRKVNPYKRKQYKELIKGLTLTPGEYLQLKRAFQGGFTHASPFFSGKIVENVASFDFTSSYPAVMVSEKFPMSKSRLLDIATEQEAESYLKNYCCLFDVEIFGLETTNFIDSPLSESRCFTITGNKIVNNGRIVSAEHIKTTLTEQDYFIMKQFYSWESMVIMNFRVYKKDYLPKDFVLAILELYKKKTELKGVEGSEVEYLRSKEMINSAYGMSVTDIVRDIIGYEEDWLDVEKPDLYESIEKYNDNPGRFLFYPWGVWVTAYARRNLFSGIVAFGEDYIYSDTDSIKARNYQNHVDYIDKYNDMIRKKLYNAMKVQRIDASMIEPKTIEGISKCLGVWDFEGVYNRFKTLGAKRYMVEIDKSKISLCKEASKRLGRGDFEGVYNIFKALGVKRCTDKSNMLINITVSGLNKYRCVDYICRSGNPFNFFNPNMYIPSEYTGKNTHAYIDTEVSGEIEDYTGKIGKYHELSFVHLEPADYSLSLSKEYADYILGFKDIEV